MATEIVRQWTTITRLDGGVAETSGNAAANTSAYGNKEANFFWAAQTTDGPAFATFLSYERNGISPSETVPVASATAPVTFTPPAAQMTAWASKVATMQASVTMGGVTYPGTAATYARENENLKQVSGDLVYGNYDLAAWQAAEANAGGADASLRARAVAIGVAAEAQATGWAFNMKSGDSPANAGQTGPAARTRDLWDNGNYGSNRIGVNAV